MEGIDKATVEAIENSTDSDAKLALELQLEEQDYARGRLSPKRRHDSRSGSIEPVSPTKKPRRVPGVDDLSKISNLDLSGDGGKRDSIPDA